MKGQFLNEQKYQNAKSKIRIIAFAMLAVGAILFAAGLALLIVGIRNLGNNKTMFGALGGILMVFGFGIISFSGFLLFTAHAREIASFGASGTAPVAGETINYVADEAAPAVEKTAEAIANGVRKSRNASSTANANVKYCTKCGVKNKKDAKFCIDCGEKF